MECATLKNQIDDSVIGNLAKLDEASAQVGAAGALEAEGVPGVASASECCVESREGATGHEQQKVLAKFQYYPISPGLVDAPHVAPDESLEVSDDLAQFCVVHGVRKSRGDGGLVDRIDA